MEKYSITSDSEEKAYKFETTARKIGCDVKRTNVYSGFLFLIEASGTIEQIRRLKASTNQVNYSF